MTDKKVIEKSQYVDILNEGKLLSKYAFQELMNKFGFAGTNWRYDGSRSIIFKDIISGKDTAIDKQTLTKGGTQKWSMADATKTITREREYYDFSDEIYAETAEVDGMKIMAAYEAKERPTTVNRGISEDLYGEAENYNGAESAVITTDTALTPAKAWEWFDAMKAKLEDNAEYDSDYIFYCVPAFLRALQNGDINKRVIMNGADAIKRQIGSIDGVEIRTVNPKNMKTKYDGTGEGLVPAADAKNVLAFMVAKDSVAVPFIIESVYIDAPHAGSKGKWEISNRFAFNAIMNPFFGMGVVALVEGDAVGAEVNP